MKPIDYIYKNLDCFNISIFKQIVEESGEEVSESIYDYLMETTWNTNPALLKQFGLDIERSREGGEDGEDELEGTVLFDLDLTTDMLSFTEGKYRLSTETSETLFQTMDAGFRAGQFYSLEILLSSGEKISYIDKEAKRFPRMGDIVYINGGSYPVIYTSIESNQFIIPDYPSQPTHITLLEVTSKDSTQE